MEIIKKKLSDLKLAPYNPRKISEKELKKLEDSLDKFGYIDPIIWNKKTGNVVGGHQRLKLLNKKFKPDDEIDISVVDLDEYQEKALNLALNKINGEWEEDALTKLLDDLKTNMPDMLKFTGFDESEVNKFIRILNKPEEDFNIPKEPKYKVQTGDIYQLGTHRLMCGDCTIKENVDTLMGGGLC